MSTLDAASSGTTGATGALSLTFSHTVTSLQSNLLLLIGVHTNGTIVPSGVTYGGVAMSQTAAITSGGNGRECTVWSLIGPATGANNVVITLPSSQWCNAESVSYYGVDQTTPLGTAATVGVASGTSSSTTVSCGASDQVFSTVTTRATTAPTATGTSQASQGTTLSSTNIEGATSNQPGGASITSSWSIGATADSMAEISVAVLTVGSGGGGGPTALTVYETSTSDTGGTIGASAGTLASTAPSAETQITATKQMPQTTTGWVEICGVAQSATTGSYNASEPLPSGNGWIWDVTTLESQRILAGTWTPAVKLTTGGASNTVTLTLLVRAFVRHSGGTYTQLTQSGVATDIPSSSVTLSATTVSTLTFAGTALDAATFATGDKLYVDLIAHVTTGFSSATASRRVFKLSVNGGAADGVATPGYQAPAASLIFPTRYQRHALLRM